MFTRPMYCLMMYNDSIQGTRPKKKVLYFNGCPVRNLVASSTLESGFASKYWQASLQSSRLLSIAAVPDGNLDGFWVATMDPLSTLSWVLGVTRKRTSWQMSVTDWCKTFTTQLLPGLAFRLPGRRPCCCGPVLCGSDPKAACNCFVTAAAFLSGTVSPELGKKTPCKSVCALTENTINMLAASCGKHPPKLQTQHQHDFYLLPLARAHCHLQRQRHHDLRYRQHQQQPTAPAAAAPAPSSSGSGGAAAEGVAAPPLEPPPATASTRPAGPSTRTGPDQHQTCTTSTTAALAPEPPEPPQANPSTGTTDRQHKQAVAVTAKAKTWKF